MLARLKPLRQEYGYSQQQLASLLGVSQQSINKYENHGVEPDIAMLCQMSALFDTTVDYLVGRSDERKPPGRGMPRELTASEAELLSNYRLLSPKQQRAVLLHVLSYMPDSS